MIVLIIDEKTKDKLISEDFNNKEIIKPLLRGRDIDKWRINYDNLYLIFTRRGIDINRYPIIKKFLSKYKEELTPKNKNSKKEDKGRKPGHYKWYEIQDNIAYHALFEKEKIIYSIISPSSQFILDDNKFYTLDSTFIMVSSTISLKYLIALLNSKLLFWIFKDICYSLNKKGFQYKKIFIEQLPIKFTNELTENNIVILVEKLINVNQLFTTEKNNFHNNLIKKYNLKKISKKLIEYYKLSVDDFFKELKKQKCEFKEDILKKRIESEFKESCNTIVNLLMKIDQLEIELNNIIYNIYGLNDDEIKIIEDDLVNLKN